MNTKLLAILLALTATAQAAKLESAPPPILLPQAQQLEAAHTSARLLTRYHYKVMPLDNAMSEQIFNRYLKSLDSEKLFFTQADIDHFSGSRTRLDDAIFGEDLTVPFAIFNLYERRFVDRLNYARSLLKRGFDFNQEESYHYARSKEAWASSEEELQNVWRKRVKNDWLMLKLAGKKDKDIRATLDKRYSKSLSRVYKNKSEDVFQIFMDAYAMSIEPHTNYLGPKASDSFNISMKLSLVGIGAVLVEKDEYTTIRELVAGGPAMLSGKLKVGDRIVGVGQGKGSVPTDVVGWRIDDTVELIRGKKDTVVVLDILPANVGLDGKHKLISLVRDKINLEEQAVKKSIIEVKNDDVTHKIGVISLPTFYQDFEARGKGDQNFRSATRDVTRALDELKKDKVDSILIDLRNNGGGSLSEAIEMTGLFIDKGPVVQQRNAGGDVSVQSDENEGVAWSGPLGVLINRGSASASEIFAAAMQDYGRAVIIGEPSFGKGTVQTVINLDEISGGDKKKFGELKMTIAQFFRIDGGTTQLRGVLPDINFPSASNAEDSGEASHDNALPWVQIDAANYQPAGDLVKLLPSLRASHEARIDKNRGFRYLAEDIAEIKERRKSNSISLNLAERRKEKEARELKEKTREKEGDASTSDVEHGEASDDGLQANERSLDQELVAERARKKIKDVLLDEAANILSDEVSLVAKGAIVGTARAVSKLTQGKSNMFQ
ncbi:MAG: carboxy terminal-processing peptidase [Gallionella sp.]|nr:carboxy terminal-processing peptidase [Gallionella sp.]